MLNELIKLYEKCHYEKQSLILEITHDKKSLILEITHDKICDWGIYIEHRDSKTIIYHGNGELTEQVCRAYLALKEWAIEEDL